MLLVDTHSPEQVGPSGAAGPVAVECGVQPEILRYARGECQIKTGVMKVVLHGIGFDSTPTADSGRITCR